MYESNRELLGLCYDSVVEIRDGYYIIRLNGKYGVVDAGNKIMIPVENYNMELVDELLFVEQTEGHGVYAHNIYNFERSSKEPFHSMKRFTDCSWIVSASSYENGIMNNLGKLLFPMIYSRIWKVSGNSQHDFLKLKLDASKLSRCGRNNPTEDRMSYIRVDKQYTEADGYFSLETDNESVQIVATSLDLKRYKLWENIDCKYRLRRDGKLVGPEFDSMLMRNGLKQLGLIQTYNDVSRNETYTGIMSYEGVELVPCNKYNDVQYIGNGISIISKNNRHGTFVNGNEVVPVDKLDKTFILGTVPISAAFIGEELYYIGNDGNIYKRLEEAFPIYKSKLDSNINLLCMYGTWIYVTNELKLIHNVASEIKDMSQWIKL